MNSAFLQALALIYKGNIYSIDKKQDLYKKALNIINIGLSDNCTHPDLWFAYGEWWFYIAEMPLAESKIILEAVNADLYMILPKNNRLLYLGLFSIILTKVFISIDVCVPPKGSNITINIRRR